MDSRSRVWALIFTDDNMLVCLVSCSFCEPSSDWVPGRMDEERSAECAWCRILWFLLFVFLRGGGGRGRET